MEIRQSDLSEAPVQELLELHQREMLEFSPPGTAHVLDISGLKAADVAVFAAWDSNHLLALGAIRLHDGFAEIKSMRTAPDALGKGYGRAMLEHLIEYARTAEHSMIRLETGTSDVFAAANRLYQSFGFVECGPFAGYPPTEFNRFYELAL